MLQAALAGGTAHRRSVFELFPRRLPEGRRYGVVAGVGRALDAIERFRFDDDALDLLADVVDEATLDWLARLPVQRHRSGATPRARCTSPTPPSSSSSRRFAEAVLLETLLLSIYNHDSADRVGGVPDDAAAGDRPCIEMGSRRTHEEAAVACARAAYVAGFASSSNLAARHRYGVPTAGTSAHSFTLLHDTEEDAFRAPGRVARARARRCSSTPTTSRRRSGSASRSPAPTSARSGSTPATSARPPARCAPSSTTWARPAPGSW